MLAEKPLTQFNESLQLSSCVCSFKRRLCICIKCQILMNWSIYMYYLHTEIYPAFEILIIPMISYLLSKIS